MEQKATKSVQNYMRSLHRNIGFFLVGLVIIYSLSGVVLIYRDTNFLKHATPMEKKLSPGIPESDLGKALQIRDFKIEKSEGDIIFFENGTYNKVTGVAAWSAMELPGWFRKFADLHKTSSRNFAHWFTTIFGILLLFMALSSFWMFKRGTKFFRRGIVMAGMGIVAAALLMML
jgi:hypothetical protein